ncbi:MAG: NEAT domain-containing protein [Clostridiales Family XIII bacterium]|jgi:uncharacterized protein with FMN-binding domain|nr:NEAT domain-containing protein [Clostridiales Family XIII bacterium]
MEHRYSFGRGHLWRTLVAFALVFALLATSPATAFADGGGAQPLDKDNLADGTYSVQAEMVKTNRVDLSMANNAIDHDAVLTVEDGNYSITLQFSPLTIPFGPMSLSGYLSQLSYYQSGFTYDGFGSPQGTRAAAEVLSIWEEGGAPITDTYNDADSPYPKTLKFPLVNGAADADGYVPLRVFVPIMEAISTGSGAQDVLMRLDWNTLEAVDVPAPTGYVPGIYSGVGQGYAGNPGGPDIQVFVQVTADEIVKVFIGAHSQSASFFGWAVNGSAFTGNENDKVGVPQKIVDAQSVEVDAVSSATLSSNGIKQGAAAALENARAGIAAVPDETLDVPAVMWKENAEQASMMNPVLAPEAIVQRYGQSWTATVRFVPASIMGLPVDGSTLYDLKTSPKTTGPWAPADFVNAPISESYDEGTQVKTVTFALNDKTSPLPIRACVAAMGDAYQNVRLKLTYGVEKDALAASIAQAEEKASNPSYWTPASYAPFASALTAAQGVYADADATQGAVDAARTALVNAMAALARAAQERVASTLAELVDAVKTAIDGDVIRLGADITANADGPQSDSKRLLETKATFTVEGDGHFLDGVGKFGFFYIRSGKLTLNDLVIKNAVVDPTGVSKQAGPAVYLPSSGGNTGSLEMNRCLVTGSDASAYNGGIYIGARPFDMTDCTLVGGKARTGSNLYIDQGATGTMRGNFVIGGIPALETTFSDLNFGAAGGGYIVGEDNIIGHIYSGYLPASVDGSTLILGNLSEADYTPESWNALAEAWEDAYALAGNPESSASVRSAQEDSNTAHSPVSV